MTDSHGDTWDVIMGFSFPVTKRYDMRGLTLHFRHDAQCFEHFIKHITLREALYEGIGWCPPCLRRSLPQAWYATFAMISATRV